MNYIQYDKHPKNFYTMSVRPIKIQNKTNSKKEEKESPYIRNRF